jgi:hypothetical protein
VLVAISGGTSQSTAGHHSTMIHGGVATGGLLALGPLLMILFRRKYRKHSRPRYA